MLTLIHLIGIPLSNTPVSPARSTGVALFHDGWAIELPWLRWLVPLVGGIIDGLIYHCPLESRD